jgi:hypothetical protein
MGPPRELLFARDLALEREKLEPERKNLVEIEYLERIGIIAGEANYKPDSRVPTLTNASICSSGAIKNEFRDISQPATPRQVRCREVWRTAAKVSSK